MAGPGVAVNFRRTGSSRSPIASGWISRLGRADRDRRADLEHVCTEDALVAGHQVVRVVLHERGAARQTLADAFIVRSMTDVFQSPSPPNP